MNWNWIAGFYEGEGSPSWGGRQPSPKLTIIITQTSKQVLQKIVDFIGYGRIHPRRWNRTHGGQQDWMLVLYNKDAHRFAQRILPRMHSPQKIRQLQQATRKFAT